jgi:hypothetical protein
MRQLLAACPKCESLLAAYGQERFKCEERKKSAQVEGYNQEAWEKCLQIRQEILSHLLRHDAFETTPTQWTDGSLTVSSQVASHR